MLKKLVSSQNSENLTNFLQLPLAVEIVISLIFVSISFELTLILAVTIEK